MMSSSELQRISLATAKVITPMGSVNVQDLNVAEELIDHDKTIDQDSLHGNETKGYHDNIRTTAKLSAHAPIRISTTKTTTSAKPLEVNVDNPGLTNGIDNGENSSPNRANETITSSVGDITVDSVRDHLNATTTTLCSTTTEETVGKCKVFVF